MAQAGQGRSPRGKNFAGCGGDEQVNEANCGEEDVWKATRVQDHQPGEEPTYSCQATRLPYFTTPLRWWDIRQYVEDYTSGNVTLGRIASWLYLCLLLPPNSGQEEQARWSGSLGL